MKSKLFKNMQNKTVMLIIYCGILTITLGIAVLLFNQYRYFEHETRELAQVKEAYYQHVEMLKRSLNASIVQDGEEEDSESEKKKIIDNISDQDSYVTLEFTIDDAEQERTSSDFQLLNAEEETRLSTIKSTLKKTQKAPVIKRKKISKKIFYKNLKRPTRYTPQRDFVFCWPVDLSCFWLSSLFGPRRRPSGHAEFHYGIDMAAMRGTPVKAAATGTVILAQQAPGYGNCIMIKHNERYKTRYGHLHRIHVQTGQIVQEGEVIGTVGATGLVRKSGRDASHLHFEIYRDGTRVNPLIYLFT